jgi:hypothetical protein
MSEEEDYADRDLPPPEWWVAGVLYPVVAGAVAFSGGFVLLVLTSVFRAM